MLASEMVAVFINFHKCITGSESEEPCKKKMKTKVYRNDGCLPIAATPETMTAKSQFKIIIGS